MCGEKIWGLFHCIPTLLSFVGLGVKLLKHSAGIEPLHHDVTNLVFKTLFSNIFPSFQPNSLIQWKKVVSWSQCDKIYSWLCLLLSEKDHLIIQSQKQELLLALWELFEDEMAQIWTVMESYQNHWRLIWLDRLVDRRGLIHVNEQAHVVFSAIKEVRSTYVLIRESKMWGKLWREKTVNLQRKLKQMMMYNCIGQNLLSTCPRRLQKATKDDYWKWITIIGHSFCKTLHGTMVSTVQRRSPNGTERRFSLSKVM